MGSPIVLALKGALLMLQEWANDYQCDKPIAFLLDQGIHAKATAVEQLFGRLRSDDALRTDYRVGASGYELMSGNPELQAADFHAYETWKHVRDQVLDVDHKARDVRRSQRDMMSRFGRSLGRYNGYFDASGITKYLEAIGRGERL